MDTTFLNWKQYFLINNQNLNYVHWDDNYKLTLKEREIITKSVQQFQLGEDSEGKHLIKCAKKHVLKTKDHDYLLCPDRFY